MSQKPPVKLITYKDLLAELEDSGDEYHLLLGNGFNNSLGVPTTYKAIFQEMKKGYPLYREVEQILEDQYDIEVLLEALEKAGQTLNPPFDPFLTGIGTKAVKLDFMKATLEIVKDEVSNIDKNNNNDIRLFLKNFSTYFTLNYDPLLYLLWMKFKDNNESWEIHNIPGHRQKHLNATQNKMYTEIKRAREHGKLTIQVDEDQTSSAKQTLLKDAQTSMLVLAVQNYFSSYKWKVADIKKVIAYIRKEAEDLGNIDWIKIPNDGFTTGGEETIPSLEQQLPLIPSEEDKQNLYFLHGAFHLVEKREVGTELRTCKVTQTANKSFLKQLEETVYEKGDTILCVLEGDAEGKKEEIEKHPYLRKCFNALKASKGRLVLLGSSLAENDQHIFDAINHSGITHIYVSTHEDNVEETMSKAKRAFRDKQIVCFDYNTIAYTKVHFK